MIEPSQRPAPSAPARRGHWRGRLIVLILLIVVGVLIWYRFSGGIAKHFGGAQAQPVGVAAAVSGNMPVVLKGLGTVTPVATITVRTQINGQLQSIGFKEGQMVHKGDLLAQIDPRPYQAALAQAQGQLVRDQALLAQARADLTRYQTLARQDSISRQQVDDQVFLVNQYLGAVAVDQGQIAADQLNIAYCRITSPIDGRVGLRQVDVGNYIQTSDANGIVVVTQLQPITVIFTLPEDDLPQIMARLATGASLPVTAYDRADVTKLAEGMLQSVDNEIDTATGTVKLRADFPNPDGALFPSQFVNAHLLVDTVEKAVLIPNAAIQIGVPGSYVYLVSADGSTVSVDKVTAGVTDGQNTVIAKGLTAGQRVVIDGTDRLSEGAKITVVAGPGAVTESAGPGAVAPPAATPGVTNAATKSDTPAATPAIKPGAKPPEAKQGHRHGG